MQRRQFIHAKEQYQPDYPSPSVESQINLLKAVLQRELSDEINGLLSKLFETYVGSEQEIARSYYLSHDEIREMSIGGMHFGGHSRSHPWFDWINAEARTAEIKASAEWLRRFEPGPLAFAYPYGGQTEDCPQILEHHGFVAAFTTQTQYRHSNPYFIGRLDGEEIAQEGLGHV